MYIVKYDVKKCKRLNSWIQRQGSGTYTVNNETFSSHKWCGCMKTIEHYAMRTAKKYVCPT